MNYLCFEVSDNADGVFTIEALASTRADQHAAVMEEVRRALDWAWRQYPSTHGHADDGMDWDDDLQVHVEPGDWHVVALTLTGTARFAEDFLAEFGAAEDS